jgi:ribonucleoside-diphosphate reductase alpha chain
LAKSYIELNNEVLQRGEDGFFQIEKDKEALNLFLKEEIITKMMSFKGTISRLRYLVDNDFYYNVFEQYTHDELRKIQHEADEYHFEFQSYMAASKFYRDYALKSNDKKNYLETYSQHVVIVALYLGQGHFKQAMRFMKSMMEQRYQPASPTFINAGRARRGEMVSCFLIEADDSLNSINYIESTSQQLSKIGGGVALNLSRIRGRGEAIKDIEGVAKGVVPVARKLQLGFSYADQLGNRPGAGAAYLNIFHSDILEFLDTKKENADEDIRLSTLSIGVIIPGKFFELAEEGKEFYMFMPHTVFKEYGVHLDDMNMDEMYDELVANSNIKKKHKDAREVLNLIAQMQMQSGYPYIFYKDNANKYHALKKLGNVKMSNLCVTGDTRLLTSNGYKPIKELYDKGDNLKVVIDTRTKKLNMEDEGAEVVKAIPVQLTKKQADIYKIKTKQGFEIKSTKWHKYYINRNNKIIKLPLGDLEDGDKLLVQSGEGKYGNFHDPELAYVMGIIAGDGTITNKDAKIYLYGDKGKYKENLEKLVSNIIDKYYTYEVSYQANHWISFHPKFSYDEKNDKYTLSSSLLFHILNRQFGISSKTKTRVPNFIFDGDKETQGAYLSGLYQMDGCAHCSYSNMSISIELTQINKLFVQELQLLLVNNGIFSTIYNGRKGGKNLLPDGHGGNKYYKVKQMHKLSIQDRKSRERFVEWVTMKDKDIKNFNELTSKLQPKSRSPKHHYTAVIESIEYVGQEDVYDTMQPDYHSLIFNGIVTGNCTEIMQYQETSTINDYDESDDIRNDISCNLGSLNIVNVMETGKIKESVFEGMEMLTKVSDMTDIANAPGVRKANRELHSVGIGSMNLNGYLAKNQIAYESKEARDFANTFFAIVNFYSLEKSMEIAKEKNKTFKGFELSDYADGTYFKQYFDQSFAPKSNKIKQLFEEIHIPTINDWRELAAQIKRNGLYHAYRSSIAPTQSISYVQNATQTVLPIVNQIERRKYGNAETIYPMPYLSPKTMWYYKSAYNTNQYRVIDMIATIQQHVDQGISLILYVDSQTSTRDLARLYVYAHKKGLKSLYYTRTQLLSPEECTSCSV